MGEVFRARDTRLNRDVAIKVLPELFTADRDRLARFTREAQTLAALNHPNVAQIYGVVDLPEGGIHATGLVMELVEGEDLSQRIARGADSPGRCAGDCAADCRRARGGARAGHRPSRSEAGEHQGAA